LRIVNLRTDDVGGQHVRCELQSRKFHADARGHGFDGERLGEAGNTFQEDMAVGEKSDDEPLGQIILPDDDLAEFVEQRVRECSRFLDRFVDYRDACVHL
jgi:hypothetical protein